MSETVTKEEVIARLQEAGFSEGFENDKEGKVYFTDSEVLELEELLQEGEVEPAEEGERKPEPETEEEEIEEKPKKRTRKKKAKAKKEEVKNTGRIKIELLGNVKNVGRKGDVMEVDHNAIVKRLIEIKVAKIID